MQIGLTLFRLPGSLLVQTAAVYSRIWILDELTFLKSKPYIMHKSLSQAIFLYWGVINKNLISMACRFCWQIFIVTYCQCDTVTPPHSVIKSFGSENSFHFSSRVIYIYRYIPWNYFRLRDNTMYCTIVHKTPGLLLPFKIQHNEI